jgi:hypothetical protein
MSRTTKVVSQLLWTDSSTKKRLWLDYSSISSFIIVFFLFFSQISVLLLHMYLLASNFVVLFHTL